MSIHTAAEKKEKKPSLWRGLGQNEKLILVLFLLLTVEYIYNYYIDEGVLPKLLIYVNAAVAVFVPVWAFLTQSERLPLSGYSMWLLLCFLGVLFITAVMALFNGRIARDVVCTTVYLHILSAIFLQRLKLPFFEKLFSVTLFLGLVGFAFAFSRIDFDLSLAINRGYQWEEIFFYTTLFWCVTPYLILKLLKGDSLYLPLLYLSALVALNLIIVKRMILLQLGVILAVVILILLFGNPPNRKRSTLQILGFLAIVFLIARLFLWDTVTELFQSLFDRTLESSEDLSTFNRFVETFNYLGEASPPEIVIGRGFGGTHTGLGDVAEALHVGWGNFILKGGIPLFLVMAIPYGRLLGLIGRYKELDGEERFAFWHLIYSFPMLFLSNMHSFSPTLFLYVYCCIKIMNVKKKEERRYGIQKALGTP